MAVERLTISLEAEFVASVRQAAEVEHAVDTPRETGHRRYFAHLKTYTLDVYAATGGVVYERHAAETYADDRTGGGQ